MEDKKIIFFDGVCNLCNGFINYTITRDKKKKIYYCSLQSDNAKLLLANHNISLDKGLSTIYFYNKGALYDKSKAIMYILMELTPFHRIIARIGLMIPIFIRNGIYNFISRNRYRFFGKKEFCRIPTIEERDQFL